MLAQRYESVTAEFEELAQMLNARNTVNEFAKPLPITYTHRMEPQVSKSTFTKYENVFKDLKFVMPSSDKITVHTDKENTRGNLPHRIVPLDSTCSRAKSLTV